MILERQIKSDLLISATYFPSIALIGPRQVGKTTLAHSLEANINKPILFLDLEISDDLEKLSNPYQFLRFYKNHCVIIDEVQRLPSLFTTLRPLIDANRVPCRFILLGSASPLILRHASETLAGRIAYHELMPFSILEIGSKVSMSEHWLFGGFPEVILSVDIIFKERWHSNFLRTFTERDLLEIGYDVKPTNVLRLWQMLAHWNGNLLNTSELSNALGINSKTVNLYLDLLEGGFMIHRLQPYFINIGKRLVKSPKVYFRDSGILHHLLRLRNYGDLIGHPSCGASWESYVIEQIKRVTEGKWEMYFYRTQGGAECDLLLIAPNGKKVCAEIKFSNTPTLNKGFFQSRIDLQPDFSYIIVPETVPYPKGDGIWVVSLMDFLKNNLKEIYAA